MPDKHPERAAIEAFVGAHAEDADISDNGRLFAAISAWVYHRDGEPAETPWLTPGAGIEDYTAPAQPVPPPAAYKSGYDGGAFYHRASGTLILANRGTTDWRDWKNNIAQKVKRTAPQLTAAVDYAVAAVEHARSRQEPVNAVVAVGHSLGGGLAQAQFACLNAHLVQRGQAPVAKLRGHGTASAPFGTAARAMRTACHGGPLVPPEADAFESRLCPSDPINLAGTDRIGLIHGDLPEVWTVVRNARFNQPKALGELRFHLERYRNPAHSAYRYFEHWDAGPGRCIVVSHDGREHVLQRADLPGSVPRRFNDFNAVWEEVCKL